MATSSFDNASAAAHRAADMANMANMANMGNGSADYSAQLATAVPDVGALDLAVIVGLLGLVVLLVSLLPAWHRKVAVNLTFLTGAALWGLRFAGVLG